MPARRGSIITALVESAQSAMPIAANDPKIPYHRRLRVKLLLLICLFVVLTEALVFLPSIANRQYRWFENQHSFAYALSLSVYKTDEYGLEERALTNLELVEIAITFPDGEHRQIPTEKPRELSLTIDKIVSLDETHYWNYIISAIKTLFVGGNRVIQISGQIGDDGTSLTLLTRDYSLRTALFQFSERFFLSSLAIALIVAAIIYLLVTEILLRPIYKIYSNVFHFVMEPDNPQAILVPEDRQDEIGLAQQRIAAIETELQRSYAHQKHLAELGLAISKINHDMRNLLASAQLVSDRLATIDDPLIKRLSPRLLRTIDRAINYTHSILAYGKIQEQPPLCQLFALKPLVDEVIASLEPAQYGNVSIDNKVSSDFTMEADSEQLYRILTNLCRNGAQALAGQSECENERVLPKIITISAQHQGDEVVITVCDNGPGLPELAREHLFQPFRGSVRGGGTGLGLAICYELVKAHHGTICLIDEEQTGAHFEIRLPQTRCT